MFTDSQHYQHNLDLFAYRIQSDDLSLFGAFLEFIKSRIENGKLTNNTQTQESKVKIVFLPKIPINEILSKIDDHANALGKFKSLEVRVRILSLID